MQFDTGACRPLRGGRVGCSPHATHLVFTDLEFSGVKSLSGTHYNNTPCLRAFSALRSVATHTHPGGCVEDTRVAH